MIITDINNSTLASAAPKGQLKAIPKFEYIIFPYVNPEVPPTSCGVTKSPNAKIKTNTLPTTSPGNPIGNITYLNAWKGLQPRSKDASIIFRGIFSKEVKLNQIRGGTTIIE